LPIQAESVGFALEFDLAVRKLRPFKKGGDGDDAGKEGGRGEREGAADGMQRTDLKKKRIKVLRKLLFEQYNDECTGCLEKDDFIDRIMAAAGTDGTGERDEL
jgi:hypothetical protein